MNLPKKKIPIPPIFYDEPLHNKTLKYWELSTCWNGYKENKLTIGKAINQANEIQSGLNPSRVLNTRVQNLKDNLVMFGSKRNKKSDDTQKIVTKLYVI